MLEIKSKITQNENICAVYDVAGSADIAVICKFKTRIELTTQIRKKSILLESLPYM